MRISFFVLINFVLHNFCFSSEESPRISVIIPCDSAHIQYLPELLNALEMQSYIPDEVIISISNSCNKDDFPISLIQQSNFSFSLKILRSSKRQFAGENRNIAVSASTGTLIICQDADDLPHQQRVEIIKKLFQKTSFDFLVHLFLAPLDEPAITQYAKYYESLNFPTDVHEYLNITPMMDLHHLQHLNPEFFKRYLPNQIPSLSGVHFGNCAFKRSTFDMVQYNHNPSAQDVSFFEAVTTTFDNNILSNLPLVYYIRLRGTYFLGRND